MTYISLFLKLFDYTSVVFGQDADHEVTDDEKKLKEVESVDKRMGLFQKAKGKIVVFHKRKNSSGETQAQVEAFDLADTSMEAAIEAGDAVVVDLNTANYSEDAMEMGELNKYPRSDRGGRNEVDRQPVFINGVPSMRPEAQDVGGLLAPGTCRVM
jgi:hypothetical protein